MFHSAVPRWTELNAVRVDVPVPDLTADALAGVTERLQAALPARRAEVFDEATAGRVTPGLLAKGWRLDRSVVLAVEDEAPAPGGIDVDEVPYDAVAALRQEWIRGEPWVTDEAMFEQALAGDRLLFSATPARAFTAGGRSYGLLVARDGIGLIEDVYTTPRARRQGLAAAVVGRLVAESRAAGNGLTFLATPADGDARRLYERLGFRALGTIHRYLRRP